MRFLGIVSVAALSLLAAACEDAPSASVNENINWKLGCASAGGCSNFTYHDQKRTLENGEGKFKVSCKISGRFIEFTIADRGYEDEENTGKFQLPGEIRVTNADPKSNQCNVTVSDTTMAGFAAEKVQGTCGGSGSAATCVLTGDFNVEGWDWRGTLQCTGLVKSNDPNRLYKLVAADNASDTPVQIALDNCD